VTAVEIHVRDAFLATLPLTGRTQKGVPFPVQNFGTFGVTLDYEIFNFGKRRRRDPGAPGSERAN
jgi:hypothetical protein